MYGSALKHYWKESKVTPRTPLKMSKVTHLYPLKWAPSVLLLFVITWHAYLSNTKWFDNSFTSWEGFHASGVLLCLHQPITCLLYILWKEVTCYAQPPPPHTLQIGIERWCVSDNQMRTVRSWQLIYLRQPNRNRNASFWISFHSQRKRSLIFELPKPTQEKTKCSFSAKPILKVKSEYWLRELDRVWHINVI